MLTKKINLLISPEMDKLLRKKAKLHKTTLGAIVREGINKVIEDIPSEKKIESFKKLCNMKLTLSPNFAESPRQEAEND